MNIILWFVFAEGVDHLRRQIGDGTDDVGDFGTVLVDFLVSFIFIFIAFDAERFFAFFIDLALGVDFFVFFIDLVFGVDFLVFFDFFFIDRWCGIEFYAFFVGQVFGVDFLVFFDVFGVARVWIGAIFGVFNGRFIAWFFAFYIVTGLFVRCIGCCLGVFIVDRLFIAVFVGVENG